MPTAESGASTRILAIDPATGALLRAVRYDLSPNAFGDSDSTGLVDVEAISVPAAPVRAASSPPPPAAREDCGPAHLCGENAHCAGACPPPGTMRLDLSGSGPYILTENP
jgi:hypothetical protein